MAVDLQQLPPPPPVPPKPRRDPPKLDWMDEEDTDFQQTEDDVPWYFPGFMLPIDSKAVDCILCLCERHNITPLALLETLYSWPPVDDSMTPKFADMDFDKVVEDFKLNSGVWQKTKAGFRGLAR